MVQLSDCPNLRRLFIIIVILPTGQELKEQQAVVWPGSNNLVLQCLLQSPASRLHAGALCRYKQSTCLPASAKSVRKPASRAAAAWGPDHTWPVTTVRHGCRPAAYDDVLYVYGVPGCSCSHSGLASFFFSCFFKRIPCFHLGPV